VPDEMGSSVLLIRLPDFPGIPEPIRGKFVTHVRIAFSGSEQDGRRWVQQLRDAAPTLLDTVADMPYSDVGTIHDEPTTPVPFYAKNTTLASIDHDAIDALLDLAGPATNAPYLVELRHLDGAFSRPPRVANAVGRRDGKFILYTGSVATPDQLDALRDAHRAVHAAMNPWGTGGVCANFLSGPEVTTDELRSGFRPADFARLTQLKRRYDPDNMLRINHTLPRTPGPETA
jgi:FAD/FMN-containing dehydrogenase